MRAEGNCAISTEISSTMVQSRVACSKAGTSKLPESFAAPRSGLPAVPGRRNAIRLSEARLHAVSSRNMYSEHGFDALIRPLAGQVCHSLMVVSNWMPGSAECHAASAIVCQSCQALRTLVLADVRCFRIQSESCSTASRNALLTRTVLLEFWPETVR